MNLDGKWKVIGLTGILRKLFGNIKYIKGCRGFNRLFGIKWGLFTILCEGQEITEDQEFCEGQEIVFEYDDGKIVDRLTVVDDNKLTGEIYLDGEYVGRFNMKRIEK